MTQYLFETSGASFGNAIDSMVTDGQLSANYYITFGKVSAWANDAAPPNVNTSFSGASVDVWSNMQGGKKLSSNEISLVVPRYDWTANTVYAPFIAEDTDLLSKQFYVLTSSNRVYKCLDNAGGALSTYEPSDLPSSDWKTPIVTDDGYVWKYLFTLSASDITRFLTTDWMPVKYLLEEASEPLHQWNVQQAAADGSIDYIYINSGGASYNTVPTVTFSGGGGTGALGIPTVSNSGLITGVTVSARGSGYGTSLVYTVTATNNNTTLTFSNASTNIANAYIGSAITAPGYIPSGTKIVSINNAAGPKQIVISQAAIANGTIANATISGLPTVVFTGGGGANAAATATVTNGEVVSVAMTNQGSNYANTLTVTIVGNGANAEASISSADITDGVITNIALDDFGNGYTRANVVITGGGGVNGTAQANIGPVGGHGSNPVYELGASNIMFVGKFIDDEDGTLSATIGQKFRQIALIEDPYGFGYSNTSNVSVFSQLTRLSVGPGIQAFANNEIIYQGDNLSSPVYVAQAVYFDSTNDYLYVNEVYCQEGINNSNAPDEDLPIKGNSSGAIRAFVSQRDPDMQPKTGKVLYVENITPVTRSASQTDVFRLVVGLN